MYDFFFFVFIYFFFLNYFFFFFFLHFTITLPFFFAMAEGHFFFFFVCVLLFPAQSFFKKGLSFDIVERHVTCTKEIPVEIEPKCLTRDSYTILSYQDFNT